MKMILRLLIFFIFSAVISASAQTVPSWKATRLRDFINQSDSVLVVNFWATFCKPCIEEIPYFESTVSKYKDKKVKLLLVSLDLKEEFPKGIQTFRVKNKYASQVVWLNETNADYFCPMVDKAWMGGLPSTLIINPRTGYRKFFEEQMKPEQFEAELKKAFN